MLERGRNRPAVEGGDPKPEKHGEMDRGPDCPGLGHEPVRSLQRGDGFRVGVAFAGVLLFRCPLAGGRRFDCSGGRGLRRPRPEPGRAKRLLRQCVQKADAELNVLYRRITNRLKDDKATTKVLVAAQRAWVAFRDAECNFSASGVSGGTAHGMIQAICLDKLTGKRIDDFKSYLNCQEGALDCPVPAK